MEELKVSYRWYQSSPETGFMTEDNYKIIDGFCYLNGKLTFGYWLMLSEPDPVWSRVSVIGSKGKNIATFNIKKWKI